MFNAPALFLLAIGLKSVSAQGFVPTTFATVTRQNATEAVGSRTNNVDPSDVQNPGPILSLLEADVSTITIVKTTYTGPWTKRDVMDSTLANNPGGLMIPATATRDTIIASSTTRVLKPTACPNHNILCEVGNQPIFNIANGRCECDAIPTLSAIPVPIATPAFLNCPNMPICTSGTLVWDDIHGVCSCA